MHLENSFTASLSRTLDGWSQSEKYPVLGSMAARVGGVVILPITTVGDGFSNLAKAGFKGVVGIVVTPYNFVAYAFFPRFQIPKDYDLFSSLMHVMIAVECAFMTAVLPLLYILDPHRAAQWTQSRFTTVQRLENMANLPEANELGGQLNQATARANQIQQDLNARNAEVQRLREQLAHNAQPNNGNYDQQKAALEDFYNQQLREFQLKEAQAAAKISQMENQHHIELEQLQTRFDVLQAQLNQEAAKLLQKEFDIQNNAIEKQKWEQTKAQLEQQIQTLTANAGQGTANQDAINIANQQAQRLQLDIEQKNQDINAMNIEIRQIENDLAKLEMQAANLRQEIHQKDQALLDAQNDAQANFDLLNQNISDLQKQNQELIKQLDDAKANNQPMNSPNPANLPPFTPDLLGNNLPTPNASQLPPFPQTHSTPDPLQDLNAPIVKDPTNPKIPTPPQRQSKPKKDPADPQTQNLNAKKPSTPSGNPIKDLLDDIKKKDDQKIPNKPNKIVEILKGTNDLPEVGLLPEDQDIIDKFVEATLNPTGMGHVIEIKGKQVFLTTYYRRLNVAYNGFDDNMDWGTPTDLTDANAFSASTLDQTQHILKGAGNVSQDQRIHAYLNRQIEQFKAKFTPDQLGIGASQMDPLDMQNLAASQQAQADQYLLEYKQKLKDQIVLVDDCFKLEDNYGKPSFRRVFDNKNNALTEKFTDPKDFDTKRKEIVQAIDNLITPTGTPDFYDSVKGMVEVLNPVILKAQGVI